MTLNIAAIKEGCKYTMQRLFTFTPNTCPSLLNPIFSPLYVNIDESSNNYGLIVENAGSNFEITAEPTDSMIDIDSVAHTL